MSLESADPHDSDVLREIKRIFGKFVTNALLVLYDVTNRFNVPRQIYFPQQTPFMVNDDLS